MRYHAVRQLGASLGALVLASLVGLVGKVLVEEPKGDASGLPEVLAVVGLAVLMLVALVFAVGLVGDLVPRRILGVLALVQAWSFSLVLIAPLAAILSLLGCTERPEGVEPSTMRSLMFLVFSFLAFFLLIAAWRWGWWMMTTPRDQFLGARGWRPGVAPLSAMFRYVGLPPFLTQVRRGWLGLFLLHFVIAVINTGILAWFFIPTSLALDDEVPPILYFMASIAFIQILGAGRWLRRRADAMLIRRYQGVREWDARPPVLFLRRFDDDAKRLTSVLSFDPIVHLLGQDRTLSFDELLLENASPYGPVVAIGDPRDPVPPLGAARIFVEGAGEEWKDVVWALAEAANVIVMCVSDTEGVRWELALVGLATIRHKVILLADPRRDAQSNRELFVGVAPELAEHVLGSDDELVAAFRDPERGWRLLVAKQPGLPAFTVALNMALQRLRGLRPRQRKRPRPR